MSIDKTKLQDSVSGDLERTSSKDAGLTRVSSLSLEDMTPEDIAAYEIDPIVEAQVRWQYDKRILPAAFCMYFFSALVSLDYA
jgi:hypothetical protein